MSSSRFLKLSNIMLNVSTIDKIVIEPNKYFIHIAPQVIHSGFLIYGSGWQSTNYTPEIMEICNTKHAADFYLIERWINKG